MLAAFTMNNVNGAIGITRAAAATARPFVLSFTVETGGRLPTGDPLGAASEVVDAATEGYPAYYMINCAHPTHFATTLDAETDWVARIWSIRENASRSSHAELDAMPARDVGDPRAIDRPTCARRARDPHHPAHGGACGTVHGHV